MSKNELSKDTKLEAVDGGLLVYLSSVEEANKISDIKTPDGKNAASFLQSDGTYGSEITQDSIDQVRISSNNEERYYKKINSNPAIKATAWIETDAKGKPINDGCEVTICYGGYTGRLPPDRNTPEGKIIQGVIFGGEINMPSNEVPGFLGHTLAKAKQYGEIKELTNYGHSMGGTSAMLSNALARNEKINSDALLIEPLRAEQALPHIARAFSLNPDVLDDHTTTILASQGGQRLALAHRLLGGGVGEIRLIETSNAPATMQSAMQGHQASSISAAVGGLSNANRGEAGAKSGIALSEGMDLGQLIMGILQSIMGEGGDMMKIFSNLLQGFTPPSDVRLADSASTNQSLPQIMSRNQSIG
jgi:hypothetical protein